MGFPAPSPAEALEAPATFPAYSPLAMSGHGPNNYLQQGARTYGNLAAAFVESNNSDRVAIDLRGFRALELWTFVSVLGNTGVLRLEYALTVPLVWTTLIGDLPLGGGAVGARSIFAPIPAAALSASGLLIRMVAGLGDGAEDPQVQGTSFELYV